MKGLKVVLYAKFGKAINLDEWKQKKEKEKVPPSWRKLWTRERRVGHLMCKSRSHIGLAAAAYRPLLGLLQSNLPTISAPTFSHPNPHLPTLRLQPISSSSSDSDPLAGLYHFQFLPRLNSLLLQVYLFFATSLFRAFGAGYFVTNFWFEFSGSIRLSLGFHCSWDWICWMYTYLTSHICTFFQSYLTCPLSSSPFHSSLDIYF